MMTSDKYGVLKWTETDVFTTDSNITVNDIRTSNLVVKGFIYGDGSRISNINISDRTTDDLREGVKNLYFTNQRASNVIRNYINIINSDSIIEGLTNLYYTRERDKDAFFQNFSVLTTDDLKEGSSNLYYNSEYLSNAILINLQQIILKKEQVIYI
jgi:hypothetical protein